MISNAVGSPASLAPDLRSKIQLAVPAPASSPLFNLPAMRAVPKRDQVQFSGKPVSRGTVTEEKETKNLNTIIAFSGAGLAVGFILGTAIPVIGNFALSIIGGTLGLISAAMVNGERERREGKDDFKP